MYCRLHSYDTDTSTTTRAIDTGTTGTTAVLTAAAASLGTAIGTTALATTTATARTAVATIQQVLSFPALMAFDKSTCDIIRSLLWLQVLLCAQARRNTAK